jgi:transposase
VVLFREIRQRGYRGGQTRVKDFVRSLRPLPQADPVVRFETEPGQQMQREVLYDNMKTVVLERNAYGAGRHRFHPGFLDYAGHAGFLPRLCRPYRAKTKGKVERFIRYVKGSFWVPFAATMKQAGVKADRHAANAAASRWLREVANARVHGTTGEVPATRLADERQTLQRLPAPYKGRLEPEPPRTEPRKPIIAYQHPLSVYEDLFTGAAA